MHLIAAFLQKLEKRGWGEAGEVQEELQRVIPVKEAQQSRRCGIGLSEMVPEPKRSLCPFAQFRHADLKKIGTPALDEDEREIWAPGRFPGELPGPVAAIGIDSRFCWVGKKIGLLETFGLWNETRTELKPEFQVVGQGNQAGKMVELKEMQDNQYGAEEYSSKMPGRNFNSIA